MLKPSYQKAGLPSSPAFFFEDTVGNFFFPSLTSPLSGEDNQNSAETFPLFQFIQHALYKSIVVELLVIGVELEYTVFEETILDKPRFTTREDV